MDVLPLFRLLYAQVAASCSALATALQLRKGLKHVRILRQGQGQAAEMLWAELAAEALRVWLKYPRVASDRACAAVTARTLHFRLMPCRRLMP